jgi:hypothetical protein
MILAGVFGLPAVVCSSALVSLGHASGTDVRAPEGQTIMQILWWFALIASIGSVYIGVRAPRIRRATIVVSCLVFAGMFGLLVLQLNFLGNLPALLLLVGGIMAGVDADEGTRVFDAG